MRTMCFPALAAVLALAVGLLCCGELAAEAAPSGAVAERPLSFNRDVRPILSNKCFQCHGFDDNERQAGLRLDVRESAIAELESGMRAIVPGDPAASELLARVTSDDEFTVMPPPKIDKALTASEVATLQRWIKEGAVYEGHWAFIPPKRPPVPAVGDATTVRNPIDAFVLRGLQEAGLPPAEQADRKTLIRRLSLDLTGLPPTPAEVQEFVNDPDPKAYEKLVERLLASPRYGEHQARYWLDAARYGDTHGLHLDNYREMWPYRDWVIQAYNENKPFDEFVIEQLAGDLLPNPTTDQLVASGFNRCNVTTSEGGSINEEVLVRYAVDRAETTGTVFMGLTVGCAACHNHKFDPISQAEFYQLFAFFNSIDENAMDGNKKDPRPVLSVPSREQREQEEQLKREIAALEQSMRERLAAIEYTDPGVEADRPGEPREYVYIDDETPSGVKLLGNAPIWQWVSGEAHPVHSGARALRRSAAGLTQDIFQEAAQPLAIGDGDILFAHVYLDPKNPPKEIMIQWNTGDWKHRAYWGENVIDWGADGTTERHAVGPLPELGKWVRLEVPAAKVGLGAGAQVRGWAFTQQDGTVYWDQIGVMTKLLHPGQTFASQTAWEQAHAAAEKSPLPGEILALVKKPMAERSEAEAEQVRVYFLENAYAGSSDELLDVRKQIAAKESQLQQIKDSYATTLISREMPNRRPAYVLARGDYQHKQEQVQPGVPAVFPAMPADAPQNRLGLAQWLVSDENPLTARVTINRLWQRYFGTGLVKTSEDFGSQGEWPSHPELLDWLSVEFRESGWDLKHMHRLIVTSATYRQSSKITPEKLAQDPQNRLLSRGPRFRLDAEVIRDTALFLSGLMVEKIGGPSVKPYQPEGIWEAVGYTSSNTARFQPDSGEALYRRSLYTFWKRTAPPPGMQIFDAPTRESCTVRRSRTNTPLQALNLMNDVQYVEASRQMARRLMTEGGQTPAERAKYGFLLATSREPTEKELAILVQSYEKQRERFQQNPEAAKQLLQVGESPMANEMDTVDHAAWTMIANLLLNLNETITKG